MSIKNMDLDIPIFSRNNQKLNSHYIKKWEQPGWLSQTQGTEVTCRLCRGAKMSIVESQVTGQRVLKYCLHCKGTGKMRL